MQIRMAMPVVGLGVLVLIVGASVGIHKVVDAYYAALQADAEEWASHIKPEKMPVESPAPQGPQE